ncbi:hypothetical protein DBR42_06025 [Pelomonas sp. HMWF004]|nr:hypothetical protein DBR42_06025 [Pelomonas sp. HMWF004]
MHENIVPCAYFNSLYQYIEADDIATDVNSNSITFVQSPVLPDLVQDWLNSYNREQDPTVTLFAAVAKTLGGGAGMPRLFESVVAGDARCITVPVLLDTRRGVVLIFSKQANGQTERLIATADPEIRNGSS